MLKQHNINEMVSEQVFYSGDKVECVSVVGICVGSVREMGEEKS